MKHAATLAYFMCICLFLLYLLSQTPRFITKGNVAFQARAFVVAQPLSKGSSGSLSSIMHHFRIRCRRGTENKTSSGTNIHT